MARKTVNEKPRVAAYCRVSTDKDDQLMSLKAQQEFFEEYAEKNNLQLVHLYTDEGISGTKLKKRKAFNQMMKDAESGLFERVYVKDISRFARNAVDFLNSIRKLNTMGIKCQFITANLSTEDGELTLGILALVAQEESANLSKRVKFGKEKNAKNGKVPNIVYGYSKIKGEYFDLEIDQFESTVVRRIFDMYVNHGCGANKIAQTLNNEGLKTKRNCNWTQAAICRILSNELYIGKVINGKEYIQDYLTGNRVKRNSSKWYINNKSDLAIIDEVLFKKAQQTLTQRSNSFKSDKQRHSNKFAFSTLIQCDCCGYSYRRIYRKWKKEYIKWECSGRNLNGTGFCENDTKIDERELLQAITEYLLNLVSSKDKLLEKTIAEFKKKYKPDETELDEQSIKNELAKLKKSKTKHMEMFKADVITLDELKELTNELNASISRYENQLLLAKDCCSSSDKIDAAVKKYCYSIDEVLSLETLDNTALKRLIEKIVVTKEGEVKVHLKLFSELDLDNAVNL